MRIILRVCCWHTRHRAQHTVATTPTPSSSSAFWISTYDRCPAKPTTVYQSLPQFFSDALRALIGGRCHSSLRRRITHTLANRRFQRPHRLRRSTTHTRFRWPKLLRAQYTSSRLIQLRFARFHCLARSESGRRSSLENPASASVNLDCRPLVPTSALACPLPGNLSHLSLSFFFFLLSRKRQTSVAQVHPFSLLSYRALVHPVFSIAVMRDRTSQEPALRGNVSIAPSFSRSLTSRRLLSTRAVIAQSRGASTHSVLRASLPPPLPCFCMRSDCTIS